MAMTITFTVRGERGRPYQLDHWARLHKRLGSNFEQRDFICPDYVSSWKFAPNGEWNSSGGVDVACCAAGLACEDNFEDLCTGTSTDLGDFNAGMMFALLAGISTLGLCCIFYFSVIKKRP